MPAAAAVGHGAGAAWPQASVCRSLWVPVFPAQFASSPAGSHRRGCSPRLHQLRQRVRALWGRHTPSPRASPWLRLAPFLAGALASRAPPTRGPEHRAASTPWRCCRNRRHLRPTSKPHCRGHHERCALSSACCPQPWVPTRWLSVDGIRVLLIWAMSISACQAVRNESTQPC
jgi:hypothetical protein